MTYNLRFCHVVAEKNNLDFHTYLSKSSIDRYRSLGYKVIILG